MTKIVVLFSEPVRGRSRATELPCFPVCIHIHIQNMDFGVLQKTSKHYILIIFLQPRTDAPSHTPPSRSAIRSSFLTNHAPPLPLHQNLDSSTALCAIIDHLYGYELSLLSIRYIIFVYLLKN